MMHVKKWGHPKRDDCLEFKERNFFWGDGDIWNLCVVILGINSGEIL